LKVIQLTSWYYPRIGGVENHVKNISEGLRRLGCNVRIFTFTKSAERDVKSFRFLKIPFRYECYSILPSPSLLTELLRSDADIVHAHSYGYPVAWAAAFARKVRQLPFVYTPHSDPYSRIYALNDVGRLLPVKMCDIVIATTKFEVEHLREMGTDSAKIRLVPQGLEVGAAGPRPITEPYILCLGRVNFNQKGQDILLRAYQSGSFRQKLVFAGDGTDLPKLRKQAAGNPNVIFLGAVYGVRKWAWLGNADLVVMPSRTESYGQVAMEAMAMGRRLVVTKVGGLQRIATPYAILAEPNPMSLSEAMQTALEEDNQFGPPNLTAPSWQIVAEETFKVYNEVT